MRKTIEIDLDVNRAIETGRVSFDETHHAILRRLLGIEPRPVGVASRPKVRSPRSSGAYSTMVANRPVEANSLKELLRRVILVCAEGRPGFLDALAQSSTRRGRHIIADSPEGVYPQSPQLVEYAERLNSAWWFDTNIGKGQLSAYFKVIAKLARLPHVPAVSKRSEKTVMTLEDLMLAG